jgi:hypothetical protein
LDVPITVINKIMSSHLQRRLGFGVSVGILVLLMKVMAVPPFGIIVRALLMVGQPLGVMAAVGRMVPKAVLLTGVMVPERLTGLMVVLRLGVMVQVLHMVLMVAPLLGIMVRDRLMVLTAALLPGVMVLEQQQALMAARLLGTGKLIDFITLMLKTSVSPRKAKNTRKEAVGYSPTSLIL